MDTRKNKLPLKLIFGAVCTLMVLAFSMALTTVTRAQAAATDTPTATATDTSTPAAGATTSPSATPATSVTSTPAPSGTGSTGTVPVTGANTARSAAISNEMNRLSNVSDKRLEQMFNDLRSQVRRLMSKAKGSNDRDDRMDRDDWRSGSALSSSIGQNGTIPVTGQNSANSNQNGASSSQTREDANTFFANSTLSAAQTVLNSGAAGFDKDGNVINRQLAISTLARVQVDVRRAASLINGSEEERSERNEK